MCIRVSLYSPYSLCSVFSLFLSVLLVFYDSSVLVVLSVTPVFSLPSVFTDSSVISVLFVLPVHPDFLYRLSLSSLSCSCSCYSHYFFCFVSPLCSVCPLCSFCSVSFPYTLFSQFALFFRFSLFYLFSLFSLFLLFLFSFCFLSSVFPFCPSLSSLCHLHSPLSCLSCGSLCYSRSCCAFCFPCVF